MSEDTLGAEIGLRPATSDDVTAVMVIERESFADPWSARTFRELPTNTSAMFLVAEASPDRRVVGYIVAWYVVDEAEIANLAVGINARGHRVGGRLLQAAIDEARNRGVERIYLEVRESNVAARALYESHGFEEIGRRKKYYRAPIEDALVMRRVLGEALQ